jgi:hypothetical protein
MRLNTGTHRVMLMPPRPDVLNPSSDGLHPNPDVLNPNPDVLEIALAIIQDLSQMARCQRKETLDQVQGVGVFLFGRRATSPFSSTS